jgi:site-specific DNA-methyltransferase (adenine-specific)
MMQTCITLVNPRTDDDITAISASLDTIHEALNDDGTLWLMVTDTDDPQGYPWKLAFSLRSKGWWLRQDIISSVSQYGHHHYFFMLAKNSQYYYNYEGLQEIATTGNDKIGQETSKFGGNKYGDNPEYILHSGKRWVPTGFRNKRSVWKIQADTLLEEYERLAEYAVKGGSDIGHIITDPFDTWEITQEVATNLGREFKQIT